MQSQKTVQRAKEAIAKKARSRLVADEKSKDVVVEGVKEGIRFTITGRVLFESGQSQVKPSAHRILLTIAEILNDMPKLRIRIEGHTDDSPIVNSIYRNNWRLSQARAASVLFFSPGSRIDRSRADEFHGLFRVPASIPQ